MILVGDALTMLKTIDAESVRTCITSPPYWGLRDYGVEGQLGLEKTPDEYVQNMVQVFREVRRVLADDGTLWLNLGDSYGANYRWGGDRGFSEKQKTNRGSDPCFKRNGVPSKQLIGIPWRVALALQSDGWFLRQDIIWHKPNPMPESVRDRCTKAHEYVFLLAKSKKYFFDLDAIKEPAKWVAPNSPGSIKSPHGQGFSRRARGGGKKLSSNAVVPGRQDSQNLDKAGAKVWETRQKRSVWTVSTVPFKGAHFATFPPKLVEPCLLAGSAKGDTVLDPFLGSGTVAAVALKHGRKFVGIELNSDYAKLAADRIKKAVGAGP